MILFVYVLNVPGDGQFSKSSAFGILSFHPVSVGVTGIIAAEGINLAVRCSIMNSTPSNPLEIIIVIIHKMHAKQKNSFIGMAFVFVGPGKFLVRISVECLEKFVKGQTCWRIFGNKVLAQ